MFKCLSLIATGKAGRMIVCSIIGLLCSAFFFQAAAQQSNISLQGTKTVSEFLKEIEAQTNYRFVYNNDILNDTKTVSATLKNVGIDEALREILAGQNVEYVKQSNGVVVMTAGRHTPVTTPTTRNVVVTGAVKDKAGTPLANISVTIPGTTLGTITNNNGEFSIRASKADSLVFSSVNYVQQSVFVGNNTLLNIVLEAQEGSLAEVVVVGYGQQRRQSLVSSISTVKGSDIRQPGRSLTNNLAGQVSGLIAIQRSGEPGYDNSEFWIRGISTFAGGSSPLVLVDGVPRAINDIEPDEIETFSILKDAAATAVYGAEGANGVVIITSKRGQARMPVISFRAEHSLKKPTRVPKFVNSWEYMRLFNEALINDAQSPIFSDSLIALYENNADPDLYPNVKWMDAMLRDQTHSQRYTLNVRGGSDKAKYFVSGAYFDEDGFFINDPQNRYKSNIGVKRYNLRSNIDMDVSKTTKVSVDLSGQYLVTNYPGTKTSDIFRQMLITPPNVFPIVYSDGTISTFEKERDNNMRNPYNMLINSGYAKEWRSGIQSSVKLDQKLNFITQGLSYRALISYDYDGFFNSERNYNPSRYYATRRDADGKLIFKRTFSGSEDLSDPTQKSSATKKIYFENSINYGRTFGKHVVGGMLLYMQKETQYHDNALAFRKQGLVGRTTYGYDNRYFLEGNFGYTGSETFAEGYRFGFFPAIGLSYIVSNEDFYPDRLKEIVSQLKLRASYGRTGNDNTGGARFLYRPTFDFGAGTFSQGITSGGASNGYGNGIVEGRFEAPSLSWEIEDKLNFGVDISFLKNKINFVGDYFNYERSGILLQRRTVPAVVGFRSAPWQNYGRVQSWGFDGSLDGNHSFANGIKVGMRGTFTFTRNKITEYDELPQPYPWMSITGTRVSENILYVAERLYTDDDFYVTQNTNGTKSYQLKPHLPVPTLGGLLGPGDIKYVDLNGDGIINQFDRKRGIGNPYNPEIIYGFGLNIEYKGFYASVFLQGAGNTSVVLGSGAVGWMPFAWGWDQSNYRTFALDRWTADNPATTPFMPRIHTANSTMANNNVASTWWLRDGSFLRLKNAEVGYNFSSDMLERIKFKNARFYVMGNNLALWDHIKIWDPETGNSNAGSTYPNSRTFTLGLELSF